MKFVIKNNNNEISFKERGDKNNNKKVSDISQESNQNKNNRISKESNTTLKKILLNLLICLLLHLHFESKFLLFQ